MGTPEEDALLERALKLVREDEALRDAARQQEAFLRAAEEVGIPAEVLERAAAQLADEARQRRGRLIALGAAVAIAGAGIVVWQVQSAHAKARAAAERAALAQAEAERAEAERQALVARTFTVEVTCTDEGAPAPCPTRRDHVVDLVTQGERLVSETAEKAAHHLQIEYEAAPMTEEDGFVYARCAARATLRRRADDRTVAQHATPSLKGGHVHLEGAKKKACDDAADDVQAWLQRSFAAL